MLSKWLKLNSICLNHQKINRVILERWSHLWRTPRRQGRLPWWLCRCCKGHFGRSPPFFYCCIVLPVWVSQFSCYFPLTYITFTQWDKKMGLVYVHCLYVLVLYVVLNTWFRSIYCPFEFCTMLWKHWLCT